ncbi:hypothetical protein [Serratia sp. Se-RSBMAAmG]|uniref:hypothetical protein n=1 Tax=Serratia sp. Se-RSBMAAmG TaxID=3043305 RepID=UPI0024AF2857|nr:hypothetical protein [Serratia sp. Se-RSBMAAmG]MDI6977299.1 hypothetical protein [Serratia sp. Se-RSBMAAmG]
MSILNQENLDKLKRDFIGRCSRSKGVDGFLEIPKALEIQPEKEWLNKKEISEEDIQKAICVYNQEKSFLSGFKVNRDELNKGKTERREFFYSLPEDVFPEYGGLHYPIIVRLTYLVMTPKESKSVLPPFYFCPEVDLFQDFDNGSLEEVKAEKTEDYGELLLIKFERIFDKEGDGYVEKSGAKSEEYLYQVRHNEKGTNVHNEMTVRKERGEYRAFMTIETDAHDDKGKAIEQMGRWLRRLGRGVEIGEVVAD